VGKGFVKTMPTIRSWGFLLAVASAAVPAADPTPFDSIANPLDFLPATDATVQRQGDSLNMAPNRLRVNQAGYRQIDVAAGYAKFYCVGCVGSTFSVLDPNGKVAGTGTLTSKGATVSGQVIAYASNSAEHAHNGEGDWKPGYPMTGRTVSGALTQGVLPAALPAGRYTLKVGSDTSVPFLVSDNVYGMARDAAMKFFGVARSGDYQSWFHPASHMWDGWLFDSAAKNPDGTYKYKGALKGGWYDCGNHLKEARTNSYPLGALAMLAATMPEKDPDHYALNQNSTKRTDGIPDVLREAWVGAQFVMNSWRLAGGTAGNMILSVGSPSWDFNWWGRPENQDAVTSPTRGGRKERVLLKNWGSGSMGDFAAGMAFLSRAYRPYDPAFADSALAVARAMYETAKSANKAETAPDYTGDITLFDDMGLAAVALLWATGESKYLQEAAYKTGMPDGKGGTCASADYSATYATTRFEGGFFGCGTNGMLKNGGPTDYGSVQSLALYAFAKLILPTADTAARYGIRPGQRDTLLLRTINQMAGPLWGTGSGATITIPTGDQYNPTRLSYDTLWYSMGIGYGKSGWWNKYQFGNLTDLYLFYDMLSLVEGRTIVDKPGNTDWKRKEILQVLLGGLNYMFGTNALDLSYVMGVGRKNPMHPHHRAANPEGRNVPGAYYNYTVPVGGLFGGLLTGPSTTEVLTEKWGDPVQQSEANCPDAQVAVVIPLMGLSREMAPVAPVPVVKVLYTTDTSAVIQVDLDKWGSVSIGYGLDSALALQTKSVAGGDTGNTFRIQIPGLKPATQYFFHVDARDLSGLVSTSSRWAGGSGDSIPFSFTTKATPASPAQYASIKVCNVTSDSAEILWYTPNGDYFSSVQFADSASWKSAKYSYVDTDLVGAVRVRFHHVKLTGLSAKTTYEFRIGEPGAYAAGVGCFRTPGEDVKFDIRTTHYTWDGKPALGLAVVNQDVKSYDSLQIRLYVNGTRSNIVDLAARVDIAFAYGADGFADSGLFSYTSQVQKSRPKLIDSTCNPDVGSCAWYFDLPMYGAVMQTQARWRLDIIFDRHNLIRDSTELLNMAPTHDPFGGTDWSFRTHVAGGDGGLSPVAYAGVPLASKNAIDSMAQNIPVNPYIAVYRRDEFVYGFSPSAAEQATKRTVYAMDARWQAPFDIATGGTVQIGAGTASSLRGTVDVHDALLPDVKGYVTSVWVNGTALTTAERKAAFTRQADGTWAVNLPLRFTTGTNQLDVVLFAGSDSLDTGSVDGTCSEAKGCSFLDANWYVNYVSNLTNSVLSAVDAAENPVRTVVSDSSTVRIRVTDGNANLSKTAVDTVLVSVRNLRTGTVAQVKLPETGASTGVFQTSGLLAVVSGTAAAGQVSIPSGDSVLVKYVDAGDPGDSSWTVLRAKSSWPSLVSGAVVAGCGAGTVHATLDRSLRATDTLSAGRLVVLLPTGDSAVARNLVASQLVVDASRRTVSVDLGGLPPGATAGGRLDLVVRSAGGLVTTSSAVLSDSVGPWLDSAKVVENLTGNATDSVYFWTSEPLATSAVWPFLARRAGVALPASGFAGSAWSLVYPSTNGYLLVLPAGKVASGDSLRLDPSTQSDALGNPALDCPSGSRRVGLIARAAPISRSWISDSDGDGRADQLHVVFGKSVVAKDLPDSLRAVFGPADSVRTVPVAFSQVTDSILVVSLPVPFPYGLTSGSGAGGAGSLVVWKSGSTSSGGALADSVGPVLVSAALRYGSSADSLLVRFSEPVRTAAGSGWILLRPGTEASLSGSVPDSVSGTDWLIPVATGSVNPGDSVHVVGAQRWADGRGRKAPTAPRWIPVTGTVRPPAGLWISDSDGDGLADQVTVVLRKTATAKDVPDSIQIRFGISDSLRTLRSSSATFSDSTIRFPLAVPFSYGITRGSAPDGSGTALFWKTDSVSGPFALADSTGPVLVSAALRFGDAMDTLDLRFSEPVDAGAGAGWLASQTAGELGAAADAIALSSTDWLLPIVAGTVAPGDLVRPLPAERFGEALTGRKPSIGHPWIAVRGSERAPAYGYFRDSDGDGAVDQVVLAFLKPPRSLPGMSFLWPSATGGFDTAVVDSGAWSLGPTSTMAVVALGPFASGVTSSPRTDLGRWFSNGTFGFPVFDSVPPVLVSAVVRYASADGVPDTLHVRSGEPPSWLDGFSPVRHLGGGGEVPVAAFGPVLADADGMGLSLLLNPDSVQFSRGDSAAWAAQVVSDLQGNAVPAKTRWVPIVFGPRPIRVDFKVHGYMLVPDGSVGHPGPSTQVWYRARGDRTWTDLGGAGEVLDTTGFVGITATINRPMSGGAYIFDNSGVHVASLDLSALAQLSRSGALPVDAAGMYQIRIAWDGRLRDGNWAASGAYVVRLLLKDESEEGNVGFVNRVFRMGFKKSIR
jgi:hypothetical protein